jgi:translation initiation factor 2B subunit (eIF-2B alpha/beta/delta family)
MLANDRISSATVLAARAESLLRDARERGQADVRHAARQVCEAQPSMGSLWNLAAVALDSDPIPFNHLAARARRSPIAVARYAVALLQGEARRVITCSRSAVVETCVRALRVPVLCAESRPRLEGRGLAAALAADGIPVTVAADAAIASDLRVGDVVLVGADAVAADWFINKTGTGQLCAAAHLAGIAVYVVAGREKCVSSELARLLRLGMDDPAALWPDPPQGVRVVNPLFERVSLDRVVGVLSDVGLLAGDMVRSACEATVPTLDVRALVDLLTKA